MPHALFLCLGNICRSPAAQAVAEKIAQDRDLAITFDSAGLGDWHAGEAPDARMTAAARRRGYDLRGQEARAITPRDYHEADFILCADFSVHERALRFAPAGRKADLRLLMDFAGPNAPREIPDPYYGGAAGFERVLDLIEEAIDGLLDHLEETVL